MIHDLKIRPEFFAPAATGKKRAELRYNDRDYQEGDLLLLREWEPGAGYTGQVATVAVIHVDDVGRWLPGYVLLSFGGLASTKMMLNEDAPTARAYRGAVLNAAFLNALVGTTSQDSLIHQMAALLLEREDLAQKGVVEKSLHDDGER
ncbi:DUF3850 domain-containing protein [Klebsiella huaxiensis]|uniref:DUF3850 domain-containing protein n=1 Tax=Klebsiella huaxiensis TaxID=2153354 RepID=UPI0034E97113